MSLIDTDWSAEWVRRQKERRRPDDPAVWDKRAGEFIPTMDASPYASAFIELMDIRAGESVLDVGSGSGTLALPLARQQHDVFALDFSGRMLAQLERQASAEGLRNITTIKARWEDDWKDARVPVADIAVASRSTSVMDLGAALRKLDAFARRRACITVATSDSIPRHRIVEKVLGRSIEEHDDYIYCLNILFQLGITPEVRFIRHEWDRGFAGPEQARRFLRETAAPADGREEALLERFLEQHLTATSKGGDTVWKLDESYAVEWAFMSWDKSAASASECRA
jgi:SAM-dependent methyltransferase